MASGVKRFGPISERELDIAEYVAKEAIRAAASVIAELTRVPMIECWSAGLRGYDREQLRSKIEAAEP